MGRSGSLVFALLTGLQVSASLPLLGDDGLSRLSSPVERPLAAAGPKVTASPSPWTPRERDNLAPRDGATSTAEVITSIGPSGTVQSLASRKTPASGFIPSSLDTHGHVTSQPLLTEPIPEPTSLLVAVSVDATARASVSVLPGKMVAQDIFADPVSTDPPPANIGRKDDHPVPRLGITASGPIATNKFYGGFYLGEQTSPSFLHPYSVSWARGGGATGSWGLAISHVEAAQRAWGPTDPTTGAAEYFVNPIGIHSVCISAEELGSDTTLTTESPTDFSVQVSLRPNAEAPAAVQFPLVQGSAFVTAIFDGARPLIQTSTFFRTVTRHEDEPKPGVTKYSLLLEDGTTWLLYAHHTSGDPLDLQVVNNGLARAGGPFHGIIQVAKDPGNGEGLFDQASGAYATGVDLSGSVNGNEGRYTFSFRKAGIPEATLAMFALPHHQSSFDDSTRASMTDVRLQTTTKGVAAAVLADSWTMVESNLPADLGFLPWSPTAGTISTISDETKNFIHGIAQREVSQDMLDQADQGSMYFSGKALAKFATLVMAIRDLLGDEGLAYAGLDKLKVAFARFSQNEQQHPLVYESKFFRADLPLHGMPFDTGGSNTGQVDGGGVVSSATYDTGDPYVDFGNAYYNDHHFHFGYFIYTAAVIGYLDPSWIPENKAYVDMLVRDVSNPSDQDPYFPVWRCFDWYHGHSWAHGLFDALDGKNQESSSEDSMHTYALKLWGAVSGNRDLEARGNLMLAVQARSLQAYYLYSESNEVQPQEFIGNRVAGILFENKIHHTTFFGNNLEYIHGIHMMPLLPHTPLIRTPDFVAEEWRALFSDGRAEAVEGGWKGILFGNYATIDPQGAYAFFSAPDFDPAWLDGGVSLTWYLCYSAALGGL